MNKCSCDFGLSMQKRKDQEFLVLGSQSLCDLRDKILCYNDYYIGKDYSDDPSAFDRKAMEQVRSTAMSKWVAIDVACDLL